MIQAKIPGRLILRPEAGECLCISKSVRRGYVIETAYVGAGDKLDGGILIEHGVNAVFEKKPEEASE
jgi:hypothetical protein